MKKLLTTLLCVGVLSLGAAAAAAESASSAPKTVIHVVTVKWKDGTTPEQIQAALDGAQKLPSQFKGITRVWTKTVKAQGGKSHVIAMEFADEKALKDYSGSDAQKEWYKVYQGIRGESVTFDVTN